MISGKAKNLFKEEIKVCKPLVLFLTYRDAALGADTDVPEIVATVPLYRTTSMVPTARTSSPGPVFVEGAIRFNVGTTAPTPITPLMQAGYPTTLVDLSFPVAANTGIF